MRKLITLLILVSISFGFSQSNEIDSLALELAFQTQDSLKVDTSLKLIESLYEINDYDRAIKYIIEIEKLSNAISYKDGIAKTIYYKSLIYAQKGDYLNAISGFQKSKRLFTSLKDTLGITRINNSIGLLEIERGNFSKGLNYSLSAINELEKRGLKTELNKAYSNLAKAYYNIASFDKAIEFYTKALLVQEELNDSKGIYESNNKLAELYSRNKEHRKAIDFYRRVLRSEASNSDAVKGSIFTKLGGEYLQFNDYDNAKKYLIRGYNISIRTKNKVDLLPALNYLGDLNIKEGRYTIAEKQLLEAGKIAKELGNESELLKHYGLMKSLDSIRNRYDSAFIWQRQYYELRNRLKEKESKLLPKSVEPIELKPIFDENANQTNSEQKPEPSSESVISSNKKLNNFKIIFYGLLAALAIVSTFLVLIYLKRNNNIKYMQQLEEKNVKIELQNEAFLEQTKHLENVNNVKDKLFSIVSHDLKDSLSSINGFIDLLKDGSLSREEFDNLIPELSENANNASLLLFNLLNWSKSQMQSLKPKPSLFDIQEVFEDKVKLVEQRMENKGITLVNHSLRDFAYADRSMFEIVIQNLLANALKFCKSGDKITIANHISNGSCIISVADTGIGISKANIDKLFNSSSYTTMGTNNEKGTGLGLSICKELVDLNNGKIWVQSTPGIGSTFYVQLPKSRPSS
ncbi:tetratricopeptide repeat-containing sensor histidine kinase [Algibacter mikhailovii]|uniref:tetratricopeptide repeat-containing sensor histidine kinase n=1 Tax=Algibacter mikhailovii TaxID=425498 RepID=UPI0024948EBA|nr:tetratricopeptide repeat-containing sensor histidine kinase [Algibacter mikhailovii]